MRHTASRLATDPPPTQMTSCSSSRVARVGVRHREQLQVAHVDRPAAERAVQPRERGPVVAGGGRHHASRGRALPVSCSAARSSPAGSTTPQRSVIRKPPLVARILGTVRVMAGEPTWGCGRVPRGLAAVLGRVSGHAAVPRQLRRPDPPPTCGRRGLRPSRGRAVPRARTRRCGSAVARPRRDDRSGGRAATACLRRSAARGADVAAGPPAPGRRGRVEGRRRGAQYAATAHWPCTAGWTACWSGADRDGRRDDDGRDGRRPRAGDAARGRTRARVVAAQRPGDAGMRPLLDTSLCRPSPSTAGDAARLAAEDVRALGAGGAAPGGPAGVARPVLSAPPPGPRTSAERGRSSRMACGGGPGEGLRPPACTGSVPTSRRPPSRHGTSAPRPSRLARPRRSVDGTRGRVGTPPSSGGSSAPCRPWRPSGCRGRRRRRRPSRPGTPRIGRRVRSWCRPCGRRAAGPADGGTAGAVTPPAAHDWMALLHDLDMARAAVRSRMRDPTAPAASTTAPDRRHSRLRRGAVRALAGAGLQAQGYA